MSISNTIKTIKDIMRIDEGINGDTQCLSQLAWMLFLKNFDEREMEYEFFEDDYYVSPLPEELRWRNWAANPEGITGDELLEFVNNQLFKTLKNVNSDELTDPRGRIVKDAFEDAFNFMKNGTLMRQVINKLNEIDFNNSPDEHFSGTIYDQILKSFQNAGDVGEYYTPRAVTQFMVDTINPQLGEKILDPACGTGGFLTGALEHLRKHVKEVEVEDEEKLPQLIMGVEKNPLPYLLGMTNMLLHVADVPAIRHDNALARPLQDYEPHERVEVILTNPPFGGMEEDRIKSNFPAAYRTKETTSLFLLLIMHLLVDGGRAGIVLPNGMLFGEGVKTHIKEKLLEEFNLHTIVRLPNGVFNPYTGIQTNLLFFTKGEPTKEIWYYEHPYPPGYKSYSKRKPIRIEEFEPEKTWWHNRVENEFAWKVSLEEIRANGYNMDIKKPSHKGNLKLQESAKNLSERFVTLLDTAQSENELQKFLEEYPEFLYPEFEECIPKPNLGGERQPDFAISIREAGNVQWIFIEIEKSSKKIFTEGKNFQFHHYFTQAKGQLLEWDKLISRDHAFFERRFPGLFKPKFHLIFGRDSELDNPRRDMLLTEFSETTNRRFSTYDDLVNKFQKILQRLGVF